MIALRPPRLLASVFQALFYLCAIAAFAWVAAYWIWRTAEPRNASLAPAQDDDWSARILSGNALGFTRAEPAGAPAPAQRPAPAAVAIEGRLRLMGIAREPGAQARSAAQALFKVDNRRILWLRVGEEIESGVTLAAVDADGVRIVHDGREIRLPLRVRAQPASRGPAALPTVAAGRPAEPAPARPADTCKLVPEQRGRAYILRPEIIDGVMREKSGWADLFKPVAEGLVVQNPGGTGAMLGLYGNDLLSRADGAQLSGPDDVLRLILQPLSRNQSVIVSGSRGGQPREWIYAGMSCLPR